MSMALALMSKLISMMLIVVVGFAVVRLGILRQEDSRVLSALCVYVLTPSLILNAFQMELSAEKLQGFAGALIFGFSVYIVWIILARVLRKPLKLDPIDETSLIYSNVGNLVLPLVNMVLGLEMVFYCSALQIPFNLLVFSHGDSTVRGSRGFQLKRLARNPNLIALALGLICLIFRIHLPGMLSTTVSSLAGAIAPVSMLVVGMVIAGTDLKHVFTFRKAYRILFLRLIGFPAVALGVLFALGLTRRQPELAPILLVTFMALCAPPAATVSQLAVLYDVEPMEASVYNVMGMFFCIVTMPLMILLYQLCFL